MSNVEVRGLALGPFVQNAYLVSCPRTSEGVLVDPGFEPERLLGLVQEVGVTVTAVVATHAHVDHVWGAQVVREATEAPFCLHPAERSWLPELGQHALLLGLPPPPALPELDRELEDGDEVTCGEATLQVLHTPGHSPGSICLHHEGSGVLLCGDLLFQQGVGRTDLPGGSSELLVRSIQDRLFTLPAATRVLPGHGPPTTIGEEMEANPFVGSGRPQGGLWLP